MDKFSGNQQWRQRKWRSVKQRNLVEISNGDNLSGDQ